MHNSVFDARKERGVVKKKDYEMSLRPLDQQVPANRIDEKLKSMSQGIQDILINLAILQTKLENQSDRYDDLAERIKECEDDIERLQQRVQDMMSARDSKWIGYLISIIVAIGAGVLGFILKP